MNEIEYNRKGDDTKEECDCVRLVSSAGFLAGNSRTTRGAKEQEGGGEGNPRAAGGGDGALRIGEGGGVRENVWG